MLENARAGDVGAMIKVGNALRNGNKRLAVKRATKAGLAWLEKAADAGSTEAMRTLVNAYERLCCAGACFDFSASESAEKWKARLLAVEEEISASGTRIDAEVVLLGEGKKRIRRNAMRVSLGFGLFLPPSLHIGDNDDIYEFGRRDKMQGVIRKFF
jgi:hypothetical protein